jgi:hypothetical protein
MNGSTGRLPAERAAATARGRFLETPSTYFTHHLRCGEAFVTLLTALNNLGDMDGMGAEFEANIVENRKRASFRLAEMQVRLRSVDT